MSKKQDVDLMKLVETEIRKVFNNTETTNKERLAAAALLMDAVQTKHKIEGTRPKKGFFDKD